MDIKIDKVILCFIEVDIVPLTFGGDLPRRVLMYLHRTERRLIYLFLIDVKMYL